MYRALLISIIVIGLPLTGRAQPTPALRSTAPVAAAPVRDGVGGGEAVLEEMKAALRNLAIAQEQYFGDHGTYTTDVVALRVMPTRTRRASLPAVQVIFAGGRGWTGMAAHRALPGKSCVMFIGIADELPKLPATLGARTLAAAEGEPMCDTP